MNQEIFDYCSSHNPEIHAALPSLIEETKKVPYSQMQISHEQAGFLRFLAGTLNASKIVEVGCFTGYSAIAMASALSDGGQLVTLDIDPENTKIAQRYFEKTGLNDKISLRIGDGIAGLKKLLEEWGPSSVDMAFIDADKKSMPEYYEYCLTLLRRGGIVVCDNVLWSGSVVDPTDQSEDTKAIREFNDRVNRDPRVDKTFVNVSDGLYLLRKL